jgi:peptide chain release factor 1
MQVARLVVNGRFAASSSYGRIVLFSTTKQASVSVLSEAVERRLQTMVRRHDEILEEMKKPGAAAAQTAKALGKELSRLSAVARLYQQRQSLLSEVATVQELRVEADGDKDLAQECLLELEKLAQDQVRLERKILDAVIPQDDDDFESNAVVEVRAGTGGDEASLFCAELLESYIKTASALKWKSEILTKSSTEIGGVREAAVEITGRPSYQLNEDDKNDVLLGPYGVFKFESGVHRVQRVPVNDSRIHTSACSVAVLPLQDDDSLLVILPSDLRIETMRSSGAGGQHVNTTDSAVRITHIPTGITASIQDERTQHKNKEKALKLIAARVRDRQREEQDKARGEARSSLMGGGDRSERIRTYNYPQDRVTDHRSKTTRHGIATLLTGGLLDGLVTTFLPDLKSLQREEFLQQLEDENASRSR